MGTDAITTDKLSRLCAIVAVDEQGAIGRNGQLLCRLPDDMRHFKNLTTGHSVIMGRATFESFPKGALPNRQNIVLTRQAGWSAPDVTVAASMQEAIGKADRPGPIFIIGGAQVYAQAMPMVQTLHLTVIHHAFDGADTFFPPVDTAQWQEISSSYHPADKRHPHPFTIKQFKRLAK